MQLCSTGKLKIRSRHQSKELFSKDKEITAYVLNLQRILHSKRNIIDITFNDKPKILALVFYAIEKASKTKEDLVLISHFLSSMKYLMNIITPYCSNEILMLLASTIIFEKHQKNQVMFSFGDVADKFYVILKGTVSVIICKELDMRMTLEEYINHLKLLSEYKEIGLMNKIINTNAGVLKPKLVNFILNLDKDEMKKDSKVNIEPKLESSDPVRLSVEEFTKRSLPQNEVQNNGQFHYEIILLVYFKSCSLGVGKTIGDIPFSKLDNKRTTAVICNEDCILGSISKEDYDTLIKDTQDKLRKGNLGIILRIPIFKGIKIDSFVSKYSNYFKEIQLEQGSCLFTQGSEREDLFFIREGEIEISSKLSFNELTAIIKDKGGFIDEIQEKKLFYDLLVQNIPIHFKKKQNLKLFGLTEGEVIGYDEYIYQNKYFSSAHCSSSKAYLYSIHLSMFKLISENEESIRSNIPIYLELKNQVLRERLIKLRNSKIDRRVKLMPSNSDDNLNKTTHFNSIVFHHRFQAEQISSNKLNTCLTSRDKFNVCVPNPKKGINITTSSQLKSTKRILTSLGNKAGLVNNYPKTNNKRELSKHKSNKTDFISLDYTDNDNYKHSIYKTSFIQLHDKSTRAQTKNITSQSNIKQRVLQKSISTRTIETQKKLSNNILDKLLNITCKNKSHSKKNIQTKNNTRENQPIPSTFNLSKIDFLALDKVYESSEKKKKKNYHPKVPMLPLNIFFCKKYKLPKIRSKRSSSLNT